MGSLVYVVCLSFLVIASGAEILPSFTESLCPNGSVPHDLSFKVAENGLVCIYFNAAISFTLTYTALDNSNKSITHDVSMYNPSNSSLGHCGSSEQSLVVEFSGRSRLTFLFSNAENQTGSSDGSKYSLYEIHGDFDLTDECLFPGAKHSSTFKNGVIRGLKGFTVPANHSYLCSPNVTTKNEDMTFGVSLRNVRFEAFGQNLSDFQTPHYCNQQEETNDLVPIIVGAALAGLVVVVLIAYLVGRVRQKQSTGYESV